MAKRDRKDKKLSKEEKTRRLDKFTWQPGDVIVETVPRRNPRDKK